MHSRSWDYDCRFSRYFRDLCAAYPRRQLLMDGCICGFRALISHVTQYTRMSPVTLRGERSGAVGALSLLFEQYPMLAAWLVVQIRPRRVSLHQIPCDDGLRICLRGLRALPERFLQECRQPGLTAADYPFNTTGRAIRSLSSRVKAELLRGFSTVAQAAGASHLRESNLRLGGFKSEAQQWANEWKLRLSTRLRAYVRRPRMVNEMHG
ncbi:hypothetical protein B0G76_8505 [Paraburkholderia sp. BL23I1N1]|nr:hypothetical protein B0G76_8505 [Paraburkholderia sp. BL23I1N1]